ncbi:hypothetical protein C8P66_12925 [Humitalea rosea]|uniref:Uncharacterized protein n=1 Tax=Humitalea rosea TaxID=990373 RepID=A0A2W7I274_9PROT|nr:hypothetical protein [Humitalea rosea]PZW39355.1 hypothetical protein C8P66_12925 [Humitalea rosea]
MSQARGGVVIDPLDRPIKDLFQAPAGVLQQDIRARLCTNPMLIGLLRQGMSQGVGQEPILSSTRDKLITTLYFAHMPPGQFEPKLPGPTFAELLQTTIRAFNVLRTPGQIALIDALQKRIVDCLLATTPAETMTERDGDVTAASQPLPSSLRPLNPDAENVVPRQRTATAWATHGIGYRVEGSKTAGNDDLPRILREGCQPLSHSPALLLKLRGWVVLGTHIAQRDRVFLWYLNRDVLNETGTCIARSLMGATALPTRDTESAAEGIAWHYLVATDCRGLKGVDTEKWQMDFGRPAEGSTSIAFHPPNVWRPGEKAFLGISAPRVLGWVKLMRRAGGDDGGWRFMLPETTWNWLNKPDDTRAAFLEAELAAWKAGQWYRVDAAYDFA